jgi:hypothetical protein
MLSPGVVDAHREERKIVAWRFIDPPHAPWLRFLSDPLSQGVFVLTIS